ncbi:nitrate reductase [Paenibacillus glycanilyticus]|uniref:assimilatory nitrate reductase catalytic subunit NasC n=1 Tax=Paenibacillus glycanilyticus TaxID=126569 RepID=UPI00204264D0|nr:nitrate reductase [Paenibacillus glycanilyticus]MCM3627224.1 nitrate reductase [Paenibacillus glycanilyticus]
MERQVDTITFSVEQAKQVMTTQCPFCSVQCKMEVVEDRSGRRPSYQVTAIPNKASEGRLCVKGMNAYQHAVSRERLLHPMIRKNGSLTRVSWEEALEAVGSRFAQLQAEHGVHTLGLYGGGSLTNESAYLLGKFARVALQTKYIDYNGRFCMSAAASAGVKTFGIDRGLTNTMSDIPLAECIILAGTNIAECQPTLMPYFTRAKDNGAVIIVIDPRVSATASIADIHLQVKPGMDAALVNGMLKVILDEKLTDESFIAARTKGFSAVKEHVDALNLEEIAGYTGVSVELIRKAAISFGKARTGMVFTARGVEQHADGHMAVRNFLNMVLATGKIGKAGCGYGAVTGQGNGQGGREHGQKADQLPGYRLIENPDDRAYIAGVWGIEPEELPSKGVSAYEMMELVHSGDIKGLFVMGSNPIVSNPNATLVEEALERAEFLVVADMFLSETAKLADIVLPVSAYLENEGTMTNLEGRVLLRPAGRPAPGEARHDWQILCDLASSLGKEKYFSFRQPEDIFNELRLASRGGIADYYGITYDRLRKEEGIYWPCPALDHPGTPRLFGESFAHQDGLAVFQTVDSLSPAEQPTEEYPLYMTNGRMLSHYLTGVQTRRSPVLTAREIENILEIHPLTAQKHRLEDGVLASVQSSRGTVIVRTKLNSGIREDTLFIPMHWGDAQNVNRATNALLDPNCRMPDFKTSAVKVQPLAEYLQELREKELMTE